jgi:hypothetical protein
LCKVGGGVKAGFLTLRTTDIGAGGGRWHVYYSTFIVASLASTCCMQ